MPHKATEKTAVVPAGENPARRFNKMLSCACRFLFSFRAFRRQDGITRLFAVYHRITGIQPYKLANPTGVKPSARYLWDTKSPVMCIEGDEDITGKLSYSRLNGWNYAA